MTIELLVDCSILAASKMYMESYPAMEYSDEYHVGVTAVTTVDVMGEIPDSPSG